MIHPGHGYFRDYYFVQSYKYRTLTLKRPETSTGMPCQAQQKATDPNYNLMMNSFQRHHFQQHFWTRAHKSKKLINVALPVRPELVRSGSLEGNRISVLVCYCRKAADGRQIKATHKRLGLDSMDKVLLWMYLTTWLRCVWMLFISI